MQHPDVFKFSIPFYGSKSLIILLAELQIRGGIQDNSKIFFLLLNENICCDLSLEPSWRDGTNYGSQHMFLWRNMENYP